MQPLLTGRYALQLLTVSLMLLCIPLEEFAIGIAAQGDHTTTMFDLKTVSISAMTIIVRDNVNALGCGTCCDVIGMCLVQNLIICGEALVFTLLSLHAFDTLALLKPASLQDILPPAQAPTLRILVRQPPTDEVPETVAAVDSLVAGSCRAAALAAEKGARALRGTCFRCGCIMCPLD